MIFILRFLWYFACEMFWLVLTVGSILAWVAIICLLGFWFVMSIVYG